MTNGGSSSKVKQELELKKKRGKKQKCDFDLDFALILRTDFHCYPKMFVSASAIKPTLSYMQYAVLDYIHILVFL